MSTKAPETLVPLPDTPRVGAGASFIVAAFLLVAVMSALAKASGGVPTTTIVFFSAETPKNARWDARSECTGREAPCRIVVAPNCLITCFTRRSDDRIDASNAEYSPIAS